MPPVHVVLFSALVISVVKAPLREREPAPVICPDRVTSLVPLMFTNPSNVRLLGIVTAAVGTRVELPPNTNSPEVRPSTSPIDRRVPAASSSAPDDAARLPVLLRVNVELRPSRVIVWVPPVIKPLKVTLTAAPRVAFPLNLMALSMVVDDCTWKTVPSAKVIAPVPRLASRATNNVPPSTSMVVNDCVVPCRDRTPVPTLVRPNAPLMSPDNVPDPLEVEIVASPFSVTALVIASALPKSNVEPAASTKAPAPIGPLATDNVPSVMVVVPS